MITHHTEPDGTLVIRVSARYEQQGIVKAVAIAEKAARHFGITLGLLLGRERLVMLTDARAMAMRLTFTEVDILRSELGALYDRRDRHTVGNLLTLCEARIRTEPSFARRYDALRAAVLADGKEARSA